MTWRDVILRRVARLISNLVYREIDVWVDPTLRGGGPIIAVANHFGGLADGVLLVDAIPTTPRIVARDVIWKIPVVGQLMTAIGGIPVHRRADGVASTNDQMFASCYDALAKGDLILIFPEGVTQDVPHIAPVKTGAARIALGARAAGVSGIRIVPVGLHYEDKAVFRSRALVNAGPALDVDTWSGRCDPTDEQSQVVALTAEITARLRAVAPDFPDWDFAHAYSRAAEIPLHDVDDPDLPLRYGDVQLLAAQLRRDDDDGTTADLARQYAAQLEAARASDEAVARSDHSRAPAVSQSRLRDLLLSVVLLPYAALGVVIGFLPWLLVQAVRLVPASPAVRATITAGLTVIAFGLEWLTTTWVVFRTAGAAAAAMAFLLAPLFLGATVFVAERLSLWRRHARSGRTLPSEVLVPLESSRQLLARRIWGQM